MKNHKLIKWIIVLPALALGLAGVAYAHRIVHVEGNLYVIMCDNNGGNFTFSGTPNGANDVAGLLCPQVAGGGGTVIEQALPAQKVLQSRRRVRGTPIDGARVEECPKGTHWYEPGKTCTPDGLRPVE